MFGGGLKGKREVDPVGEFITPIPRPGRASLESTPTKAMPTKKPKARKTARLPTLPLLHPNAAGIDVGAKEHGEAV